MNGAPILCVEIAQNKAYTALFGVPTHDFFNFIQGDPVDAELLHPMPEEWEVRLAASGGSRAIFIDKYTISVIEEGDDIERSTKSRVSVGI
jgi:uncharacterized protein GlcG (DUF336 family)